ncbi:MAG: hypothetical protein KDD94_06375, partial [Calditrichaeota bacterium]|nr:hypothetical protein [Calditrichota bacterium]
MYQLLLFFFICAEISLQGQSKFSKNYKRTDVQGDVLHVNNVKALVSNNGWLFWGGGPGGFIIPSPVFSENPGQFGTMFASGIAIAGKVDGAIRTSQVKYGSDFSPGSWDQYQADTLSINSPDWKIYYYYSTEHIDYLQELLENDQKKIRDFAQSELDRALVANTEWQTKAVGQGAPELPLGDVAVFYICHDSNVKRRSSNRGLEPLNVQVRVLQWAYKSTDAINNTIFTKVEFINKNSVPINDAIISLWADMDLGDYSDDLLGSDPQLDLAYIYNSDDYDNQYTRILGLRPPAMGYDLLQGPVIDSAGHQLDVLNSIHHIYRNSKTNQTAEMQITDKYVVAAAGVNYVLKGDDGINPIELYNTMIGLTPEGERHPFQLAAVADGLTSEMDSHFFFNGEPEQLSGWL